jgi:D-sedoheptulose 7-phosphate isomerase
VDHTKNINNYFDVLNKVLSKICRSEINKFIELVDQVRSQNKKILICGNGGSGATASHIVCDLNKGLSYGKEKKFQVINLSDNMATVLAYGNDTSFDDIFVEQTKNFLDHGDLFIGISSSGNSNNVLKAIEYANSKGNTTLGLTGYNGGKLKELSKYSVNANIDDTQISEDVHMILGHLLYKVLS